MQDQRTSKLDLPLHLLLGSVVISCGALQAWFGRPELLGDDISYLDVTNMIRLGDWKAALNPLWSIGYPLLLTAIRAIFPPDIRGELTAVFALNLTIYIATWLSFLWFLRTATTFIHLNVPKKNEPSFWRSQNLRISPYVLTIAACVFMVIETCFGRVFSIGPDQLVVCLFFLASGLLLRFTQQPTVPNGLRLGAALGFGFIVKAIFLPLAVIVLAAALLPFRRRLPRRAALSATAALLCFVIPYSAALSWALGRVTIGESGALNYAYHVNQLPHWMGWQGGPPRLGTPLHPIHLLLDHPAVFSFGEPFHVTYPPQFNLHYWYDGYNHFFSPTNAVRAIATNLHELEKVFHENWPFTLALALALIFLAYTARVGRKILPLWPLYLPSLLGIALYIQVHLEGRYIAAFVAILALVPFLISEIPRLRLAILTVVIAGTVANLTLQLRHTNLQRSDQWAIAAYLTESGLKPGDKVATVTTLNQIRCTWAYATGLHIVADIGNDAYSPQNQQADFNLFWTDPAIQQEALRLFHEQGAIAVIVPSATTPPLSPDWHQIPNTNAWVFRL
jgi:hypothetical protein